MKLVTKITNTRSKQVTKKIHKQDFYIFFAWHQVICKDLKESHVKAQGQISNKWCVKKYCLLVKKHQFSAIQGILCQYFLAKLTAGKQYIYKQGQPFCPLNRVGFQNNVLRIKKILAV